MNPLAILVGSIIGVFVLVICYPLALLIGALILVFTVTKALVGPNRKN